MSLSRGFRFTEQVNAQLRSEAFNVFNHTHFGVPNMTWGTPTSE